MATEVVLPMLGITAERGRIVEWLKQEGDPVEKGEVIFIVEVEKATTEVESPASGILAKIIIPVDVEVAVKTTVAIITEPGEELLDDFIAQPAEEPKKIDEPEVPAIAPIEVPAVVPTDGRIKAVPAARKLAADNGLDLKNITGTGPQGIIVLKDVKTAAADSKLSGIKVSSLARQLAEDEDVPLDRMEGTGVRGRIMRADVQSFLDKAATQGPGLGDVIPMSSVRKVISRRMSESAFTAPHIYFFTEVWFDPLLDFRKSIVADFEEKFDLRPSINDFLVKAVALNILDFPLLNAQVSGDEIKIMPEIHVGLAVAVEEGLIVPAIAHADRSGLVDIARQRADLIEKARLGKLTLEEMERGTFTISSLAQYDITHFTAILNPPQSGILSVGKTDEKLTLEDGQITSRKVAQIGLSVDHRIIDGAVAADFLQNLKWKLERPAFTFLKL